MQTHIIEHANLIIRVIFILTDIFFSLFWLLRYNYAVSLPNTTLNSSVRNIGTTLKFKYPLLVIQGACTLSAFCHNSQHTT